MIYHIELEKEKQEEEDAEAIVKEQVKLEHHAEQHNEHR